jgi:prophage antirepressor-like protein
MTPDTQLLKTELFHDIPVRIVDVDGIPMIPVADIVTALGYDRGNISRLMKRNADLFSPYKGVVNLTTPGGIQEMTCLDDTGVVALLLKMDYSRIKEKGFRKKVMEFQQWSFQTLKKVLKGEVQTTLLLQNPIDIINERLDLADIAVKRSGVPKEIAHAMAWAVVDTKEISLSISGYIKAQSQQLQLPGGIPQDKKDYDMYFSITKVAASLKLPIDKVRNVLESLNIIYFENGYWKLTAHGMQYGRVFMVTPGYPYRSNQKAYIKYNPLAIDLLKKYFAVDTTVLGIPE